MTERMTTITRKGQITIPVEIRRALGIAEGDKVVVSLVDGKVQLVPVGSVTRRTAGILKGHGAASSVDDERRAAEEAIAREAMRRADEA